MRYPAFVTGSKNKYANFDSKLKLCQTKYYYSHVAINELMSKMNTHIKRDKL